MNLAEIPAVHSLESEKAILGVMLTDQEKIDDALSAVTGADFFHPTHQELFGHLSDMRGKALPIDPSTVFQYLIDRGKDMSGIVSDLAAASGVIASLTLVTHIQTVRDKATLRRVIQASKENILDCLDRQHEAQQVVGEAEQRIFNVGDSLAQAQLIMPKDGLKKAYAQILDVSTYGKGMRGPSSGLFELDRLTKGFRPKAMSVYGARTNVGKSALGLTFAHNMGLNGDPCGIFSLEMTVEAMWIRLLSFHTGIDVELIDRGELDENQSDHLALAGDEMGRWNMPIAQRRGATLPQVASLARRMVKRHGIKVLIVDYLQKIKVPGIKEKRLEVAAASEGLACLAEELDIHVVALAQLGRGVEQEDRWPRLSDLKESGDVEQDADIVGLLHRPPIENGDKLSYFGKLNIAKQRNGPTGILSVILNHKTTKYEMDTRSPKPFPRQLDRD